MWIQVAIVGLPVSNLLLRMFICWKEVEVRSPQAGTYELQASAIPSFFGGADECFSGSHLMHALAAAVCFVMQMNLWALGALAVNRPPSPSELHLQPSSRSWPTSHSLNIFSFVLEFVAPAGTSQLVSVGAELVPAVALFAIALVSLLTQYITYSAISTHRVVFFEGLVLGLSASLVAVVSAGLAGELGVQDADLTASIAVMALVGFAVGQATSIGRDAHLKNLPVRDLLMPVHVQKWVNYRTQVACQAAIVWVKSLARPARMEKAELVVDAWNLVWHAQSVQVRFSPEELQQVRSRIRPVVAVCESAIRRFLHRSPRSAVAHLVAAEYFSSPAVCRHSVNELQHLSAAWQASQAAPWFAATVIQRLQALKHMHARSLLPYTLSHTTLYSAGLDAIEACHQLVQRALSVATTDLNKPSVAMSTAGRSPHILQTRQALRNLMRHLLHIRQTSTETFSRLLQRFVAQLSSAEQRSTTFGETDGYTSPTSRGNALNTATPAAGKFGGLYGLIPGGGPQVGDASDASDLIASILSRLPHASRRANSGVKQHMLLSESCFIITVGSTLQTSRVFVMSTDMCKLCQLQASEARYRPLSDLVLTPFSSNEQPSVQVEVDIAVGRPGVRTQPTRATMAAAPSWVTEDYLAFDITSSCMDQNLYALGNAHIRKNFPVSAHRPVLCWVVCFKQLGRYEQLPTQPTPQLGKEQLAVVLRPLSAQEHVQIPTSVDADSPGQLAPIEPAFRPPVASKGASRCSIDRRAYLHTRTVSSSPAQHRRTMTKQSTFHTFNSAISRGSWMAPSIAESIVRRSQVQLLQRDLRHKMVMKTKLGRETSAFIAFSWLCVSAVAMYALYISYAVVSGAGNPVLVSRFRLPSQLAQFQSAFLEAGAWSAYQTAMHSGSAQGAPSGAGVALPGVLEATEDRLLFDLSTATGDTVNLQDTTGESAHSSGRSFWQVPWGLWLPDGLTCQGQACAQESVLEGATTVASSSRSLGQAAAAPGTKSSTDLLRSLIRALEDGTLFVAKQLNDVTLASFSRRGLISQAILYGFPLALLGFAVVVQAKLNWYADYPLESARKALVGGSAGVWQSDALMNQGVDTCTALKHCSRRDFKSRTRTLLVIQMLITVLVAEISGQVAFYSRESPEAVQVQSTNAVYALYSAVSVQWLMLDQVALAASGNISSSAENFATLDARSTSWQRELQGQALSSVLRLSISDAPGLATLRDDTDGYRILHENACTGVRPGQAPALKALQLQLLGGAASMAAQPVSAVYATQCSTVNDGVMQSGLLAAIRTNTQLLVSVHSKLSEWAQSGTLAQPCVESVSMGIWSLLASEAAGEGPPTLQAVQQLFNTSACRNGTVDSLQLQSAAKQWFSAAQLQVLHVPFAARQLHVAAAAEYVRSLDEYALLTLAPTCAAPVMLVLFLFFSLVPASHTMQALLLGSEIMGVLLQLKGPGSAP